MKDFNGESKEEGTIDVVSTSLKTAEVSPIVLKETERVKTKFEPKLIVNDKFPEKSVSGKLIYEKKRLSDEVFPSDIEKLSRKSVKVGELMEIALGTSETFNLYKGLEELYGLFRAMGQIPSGSAIFTKIDSSFREFLKIIKTDPSAARMIGCTENFELVKIVLQLITQTDSLESLKNGLNSLGEASITTLTNAINVERLQRVAKIINQNMHNSDEEFWQIFFSENQWILSQIFSAPFTIFCEKAYVGGKGINNKGGNICDFIYQNNLTQNIALIEIKTPCSETIGKAYRGTYSLSSELSGSINQVLNYKDKITKEYYSSCTNSNNTFEVLNPKCLVVIGKMSSLEKEKIEALEIYRSNLNNVIILTYDELFKRINDMLNIFLDENVESIGE